MSEGPGPEYACAMDDLTAFKAALSEDYAVANMLAVQGTIWSIDKQDPEIVRSEYWHVAARCREDELANAALRADHIARHDPRRAQLDIKGQAGDHRGVRA